jgi:hypothetical protein
MCVHVQYWVKVVVDDLSVKVEGRKESVSNTLD